MLQTGSREFRIVANDIGQFATGNLPAGFYIVEVPGFRIRLESKIISFAEKSCAEVDRFVTAGKQCPCRGPSPGKQTKLDQEFSLNGKRANGERSLVDVGGIEPPTSALRTRRSPS